MKAISIKQPWAWAILNAGKDIENRTWRTGYRGKVVIHAGLKEDLEGYAFLAKMGIYPPMNLPKGCLIGEVDITDCVSILATPDKVKGNIWAFGPYCFKLADAKTFHRPIPCRGKLSFFDIAYPEA